ncbi:TIGR03085 family metal-binding protein [Mycobacterium sp.]|uniref:TIGR03085 family metal-binding protein n=1 Tax=Mycobacterium sp. TaxID=1785 RepID=UPI002D3F308F|nr:TIGR03085 family metal-binding protein [Mycobacterium sp.]HZA08751.1 TIGR03085 family metal-binding protein [Mycobacterium sp.]
MTASARERGALVETFNAIGPDAPTLCGKWTTRDLAAHLVVRERRPDAAIGIAVPALAGYTDRLQKSLATSTDWEDLVHMVAMGPPIYSPFKLLDPLVNVGEMFIHHEDVRRAQPDWQPRALEASLISAVRRGLPLMSRMMLARAPARVRLRDSDGATVATIGRGPEVVITGEAPELLLFVSGRDAVRLEFAGDAETIAGIRAARRGL